MATVSFVREAKEKINSEVSLPLGTYIEFSGISEAQAKSRRDILIHSFLTGIGIILLLSLITGSFSNLMLVLLNLPFALLGGVLAVLQPPPPSISSSCRHWHCGMDNLIKRQEI